MMLSWPEQTLGQEFYAIARVDGMMFSKTVSQWYTD